MCSVFGALVWGQINPRVNERTNELLAEIYANSSIRGRDGHGYLVQYPAGLSSESRSIDRLNAASDLEPLTIDRSYGRVSVIGNFRAEPTTEHVKYKQPSDQQPYVSGNWTIVHNGTIANDKELREAYASPLNKVPTVIDSAAIAELLAHESKYQPNNLQAFLACIGKLEGSYAILAVNSQDEGEIFVAANYRPIWYVAMAHGVFFASTREMFPEGFAPQMVTPYTAMSFSKNGEENLLVKVRSLRPPSGKPKTALVVCSGGLDSVVSAMYVQKKMGLEVELIHFLYGSRAEGPEVEAVKAVAAFMDVKLKLFPLPIYDKTDSPLLDPDSKVAGGEAGAEFAHEWVPARNLVLLSVATAYAEAKGHELLVLGNNLEEAGAYPDNEPEFIAKFNDLLPFAVGDGKRLRVIMPVGNMMKHEIVALGHELNAPMHLTWSCYRAGEKHCGTCGPCYMRRTAFAINNIPEVIDYEV